MRTQHATSQTKPAFYLALFGLMLACHAARAQTLVSGNVSGTWTPANNPYIATDNCTVPPGQTLTLLPGVIFTLGQNLSVTVNGSIQAIGRPTNRITIQAPSSSLYWNSIQLIYDGRTNRFKYCEFINASTALWLKVSTVNATMNAEIMNCNFSNCTSVGIYGESEGWYFCTMSGCYPQSPTLSPTIKNCNFDSCGEGCKFLIYGHDNPFQSRGVGSASPVIAGNVFAGLPSAAISFEVGSWAASSHPVVINNTIVNCGLGVVSQEPWDVRIQDNIFTSTTNAVKTSGALSRAVSYNDFFGNLTNFTGYPGTYGQVVFTNRNGTPSDILYNIFQDPVFVATNNFYLATNSACIDAGTPDTAFCDLCFQLSLGTQFADLGAYGGPDACNWLDVVPKLPAQALMLKTNDVISLNWGAIPRSEYQVQYVTNLAVAGTNNWMNFTNGRVLATEKPTSLIVATNTSQSRQFFRIESLGRTAGN